MADRTTTSDMLITDFVENYMEKLFYFCLKRTGSDKEAEDLTQDIALNIVAELRKGGIPTSFFAWVWQIARNRYSAWADNKHKMLAFSQYYDGGEDFTVGDDPDLLDGLIHADDISLLRRELAFISADYRNIVVSYYIDNASIHDIANLFDLPEGTVKTKLYRARKKLKEGMDVAREFGQKSYKPEQIYFRASGSQPSGLPWSAVGRKIPTNILLHASNNPSTVEELAIELGIAAPYMEEEVELLTQATLLKKMDNGKYITNFFIHDRQSQLDIYNALRSGSSHRSMLIDKIINESLPEIRSLGIAGDGIDDGTIKWWLVLHLVDYCIRATSGYDIFTPPKRANGESWGFVGYEQVQLPENTFCGLNSNGNGGANFSAYKIDDYGLRNQVGEMSYSGAVLLGDMLKNNRSALSLTNSERGVWNEIDGRYAHADESGRVIPDILVITSENMEKINDIIRNNPMYPALIENVKKAKEDVENILRSCNNEVLHGQLAYYTSMCMYDMRMMTVHDEVDSGRLALPQDPGKSRIGMILSLS